MQPMFDTNIYTIILKHTSSGSDYKNFCLVSHQWYAILNTHFPKGEIFTNHLKTLLKLQFNKFARCEDALSYNPNLSVKKGIAFLRMYNETADKLHPDMTWGVMGEHKDIIDDNQSAIAMHPCITLEIVRAYPELDWDYSYLTINPNITWDIIQINPDIDWNMDMISWNPNITWDIVQENPNINWDYKHLTGNTNITWNIIKSNPTLHWSKKRATRRFSWDIIRNNPGFRWVYTELIYNHTITWEDFQEIFILHPDLLDDCNLTSHPSVTLEIIKSRPDISWDLSKLSSNPNLTWDFVINNPKVKWKYYSIARNKFRKFWKEK